MNIYTKTGDSGLASTGNRRMIPKDSPIFCLLGTLDELGAALGVAKSKLPDDMKSIVQALQQDIILFSAEMAGGAKFAQSGQLAGMEQSIDMMMSAAGGFNGFVAAGDSEAGALLDLARTVARRAERELVSCKQTGGVSREAMMWLNRLSDLLYAIARLIDSNAHQKAAVSPPQKQTLSEPAFSQQAYSLPAGRSFLETGLWLCRTVLDYARAQGIAVVTAACDAGGNLVAFLRADGAYLASVEVAQSKAFTSVSVQMSTEKLGTLCQPNGPFYGVQNTHGGRIIIFGGGIPLFENGRLIGGFGVSGGSAEQDTALAHYAQEQYDLASKGGM